MQSKIATNRKRYIRVMQVVVLAVLAVVGIDCALHANMSIVVYRQRRDTPWFVVLDKMLPPMCDRMPRSIASTIVPWNNRSLIIVPDQPPMPMLFDERDCQYTIAIE